MKQWNAKVAKNSSTERHCVGLWILRRKVSVYVLFGIFQSVVSYNVFLFQF